MRKNFRARSVVASTLEPTDWSSFFFFFILDGTRVYESGERVAMGRRADDFSDLVLLDPPATPSTATEHRTGPLDFDRYTLPDGFTTSYVLDLVHRSNWHVSIRVLPLSEGGKTPGISPRHTSPGIAIVGNAETMKAV